MNSNKATQKAIIIGAGPAGLTAAYELITRTDIKPVIIEKSNFMGGISRTVNYKGNRIDIGGHRFFSKSDRVMKWWLNILPPEEKAGKNIADLPKADMILDPEKTDKIMLLRNRRSRIYCFRKFFDYPVSLSKNTLFNLGLLRTVRIGLSYIKSAFFPIKNEKNLEEFFSNRFGRELYLTFFKSYTEKVWGIPCTEISADWGAQRVKGLSVWKTITHFIKKIISRKGNLPTKDTETSLIEQFLYPKFGPGQMWDEVAEIIKEKGGEIITEYEVVRLHTAGSNLSSVEAESKTGGQMRTFQGDWFFSTMPVKDLIRNLDCDVPGNVKEVSEGLVYRDFITVGLLLKNLKIKPENKGERKLVRDNWIYIQEPDVDVGRLQIFNNWSPYLVADKSNVWLGLEYFCNENDALWSKSDEAMKKYAIYELDKIGIIDKANVLDATVIRMPKTYPAYFGTYNRFDEVQNFLDRFENLFLIGRNGMHRYNNQDHSMLTAMVAVDNIIAGRRDKANIWQVNIEKEYHEAK